MPFACAALLAIFIGLVPACSTEAPGAAQRALERRLLSPCCWRQTLEDHDGPVAEALRAEISRRLAAGEVPAAIEADLVARHGERIRALPRDGDPRWLIGAVLVAALAGASSGLIFYLRRARHRRAALPAVPAGSLEHERYERLLDDALLEEG
jgi:cytochrome c-type biogenesis protein CcmH